MTRRAHRRRRDLLERRYCLPPRCNSIPDYRNAEFGWPLTDFGSGLSGASSRRQRGRQSQKRVYTAASVIAPWNASPAGTASGLRIRHPPWEITGHAVPRFEATAANDAVDQLHHPSTEGGLPWRNLANVVGIGRTSLTWSDIPLADGVSVVAAAIADAKPRDITEIRGFGAEVERAYTDPRMAPFDCDRYLKLVTPTPGDEPMTPIHHQAAPRTYRFEPSRHFVG